MLDGFHNRAFAAQADASRLVKTLTKQQAEIIAKSKQDRAEANCDDVESVEIEGAAGHRGDGSKRQEQRYADQRKEPTKADPKQPDDAKKRDKEVVVMSRCMLASISST